MSGDGPRTRSILDAVPTFKSNKLNGVRPTYRANVNENYYPPLPSVLEVVREAAAGYNRYPDMTNDALVGAIAERFGVSPERVAVGAGGAAVLQQLLLAVVEHGDEVVFPWLSFEAYPILSAVAGARSVRVPLSGHDQDLPALAAAITERTRLVFVCNPNNPTGTAVGQRALDEFVNQVPDNVLIVLDEAYREFVRDDDVPDGIRRYGDRPNVAVLRTFSKSYGLAGLRVGFAVAHPRVAAAVRKAALPFGVTDLAERAAVAALQAEDELLARVEAVTKERERMWHAVDGTGLRLPRTESNFLWLPLAEQSVDFAAACSEQGVSVRVFPGQGVRVTVAEPAANDAVLAVAADFSARWSG